MNIHHGRLHKNTYTLQSDTPFVKTRLPKLRLNQKPVRVRLLLNRYNLDHVSTFSREDQSDSWHLGPIWDHRASKQFPSTTNHSNLFKDVFNYQNSTCGIINVMPITYRKPDARIPASPPVAGLLFCCRVDDPTYSLESMSSICVPSPPPVAGLLFCYRVEDLTHTLESMNSICAPSPLPWIFQQLWAGIVRRLLCLSVWKRIRAAARGRSQEVDSAIRAARRSRASMTDFI